MTKMTRKEFQIQRALGTLDDISTMMCTSQSLSATQMMFIIDFTNVPKEFWEQFKTIINPPDSFGGHGIVSKFLMDWIEGQLDD